MRSILKQVRSFRDAFREELGRCELCRKGKPQLHELTQGYGRRTRALGNRSLVVGLCGNCHRKIHLMALKGKILCLALLRLRRPADYNLQTFWEVNGRRWPDNEEVMEAYDTLMREE